MLGWHGTAGSFPRVCFDKAGSSLPVCSMLKLMLQCVQERDMCDDPAASYEFLWQLHRATMKNLVSMGPSESCFSSLIIQCCSH
jgi:hypothetical protein